MPPNSGEHMNYKSRLHLHVLLESPAQWTSLHQLFINPEWKVKKCWSLLHNFRLVIILGVYQNGKCSSSKQTQHFCTYRAISWLLWWGGLQTIWCFQPSLKSRAACVFHSNMLSLLPGKMTEISYVSLLSCAKRDELVMAIPKKLPSAMLAKGYSKTYFKGTFNSNCV